MFTFAILERKYPSLGKYGLKNQNCLFDLKLGAQNKSNNRNTMMMFTFPFVDQKYPFWANWSKYSNLFKVKFGTLTNLKKLNQMLVFTFSVLD